MRATAGIQADGRRPHANPNLHHKHRNRKPALPKVCSHPLDFHRSSNSEAALDLLDRGEPSGELAPRRLSAACRSACVKEERRGYDPGSLPKIVRSRRQLETGVHFCSSRIVSSDLASTTLWHGCGSSEGTFVTG